MIDKFKTEVARLLSIPVGKLEDSTPVGAGHLDSMGLTELVFHAEDIFNVQISWAEIDGLKDFGELMKLIDKKRNPK